MVGIQLRLRLSAGPNRVVKVDDVGVLVGDRAMPVRVAVRLRPLPALVHMLVVLVVNVQMVVLDRLVPMLLLLGVVRRPEKQRRKGRGQGDGGEHGAKKDENRRDGRRNPRQTAY